MARARSLPSDFLKDPDIITLAGNDECLILIGLILNADDYGRGIAHSLRLGREIRGYSEEHIEIALHALEAAGLLTLYEVGRFRYYSLPRWREWEKLSDPAKSKYPAPPDSSETESDPAEIQTFSKKPKESLGNRRNPQESVLEEEGEAEREPERETEGDEERLPPNVTSFPTAHAAANATMSVQEVEEMTRQVAPILKLCVSDALRRLVQEYGHDPLLSLLVEADAAREWIDDTRRRNRKGQRMSPAFFQRWLKREREGVKQRQAATGTTGADAFSTPHPATAPPRSPGATKPPSLMNLEQHYQTAAKGEEGDPL